MWPLRKYLTTDDFGLSTSEHSEVKDVKIKYRQSREALIKSEQRILTLEKMGQNLRRNNNGNYDERSKLGKKLNKDLPRARAMAFRYRNELPGIAKMIVEIEEMPKTRSLKWASSEAFRTSNRLTVIVFCVFLLWIIVVGIEPESVWMRAGGGWAILLYVTHKINKKWYANQLGVL